MRTRYLTIEMYDGTIVAHEQSSDEWKAAQLDDGVADWVWQFAATKEQAIAQHQDKVDAWQADVDNGIHDKETY